MFDTASFTSENSASLDTLSLAKRHSGLGEIKTSSSALFKTALEYKNEHQAIGQIDTVSAKVDRSDFATDDSIKLVTYASVAKASLHKKENSLKADRDNLTGLNKNQKVVGTPNAKRATRNSFNSTYGYGLVNAAKAVAWSMGYSSLPEVRDWGGFNWNHDRIKSQEVWNQGVTGVGVTVAVIDSGVDIAHPDLVNNIWLNSGELAGDGVDNDGNGYVDDLYGWNFASNQYNNNVMPQFNNSNEAHGTHVAGTIAADWNNFGTTGVAPDAKIMALRIADTASGGWFANTGNLAEAIYYAVNNGAKVINMSLSWSPSVALESALSYAASHNVIVVSAAGNESQYKPGTPASYATRYGISVGAVDQRNRITDFSNRAGFDRRMDHVVAPGRGIWSTMPTNDYDGKSYDTMQGTSMAAPHVAGVVALMLSANPYLTHAQVRYILAASASSYGSTTSSSRMSTQHHKESLSESTEPLIATLMQPSAPTQLAVAQVNLPSIELQPLTQYSIEQPIAKENQKTENYAKTRLDWSDRTLKFRETTPASIALAQLDQLMPIEMQYKA